MNKYHAEETRIGKKKFASRKEARRYQELALMQRAGRIYDLQRQVRYLLIPTQYDDEGNCMEYSCNYVADFVYKKPGGDLVVEDVKGYKRGQAYALFVVKRKLMLERYGIRVKEV